MSYYKISKLAYEQLINSPENIGYTGTQVYVIYERFYVINQKDVPTDKSATRIINHNNVYYDGSNMVMRIFVEIMNIYKTLPEMINKIITELKLKYDNSFSAMYSKYDNMICASFFSNDKLYQAPSLSFLILKDINPSLIPDDITFIIGNSSQFIPLITYNRESGYSKFDWQRIHDYVITEINKKEEHNEDVKFANSFVNILRKYEHYDAVMKYSKSELLAEYYKLFNKYPSWMTKLFTCSLRAKCGNKLIASILNELILLRQKSKLT
jgi:hypothetical protein